MIVLKVGGSLSGIARGLLSSVAREGCDVLVVPGGGEFADTVRKVHATGTLSDDAGHWMAALAMDQYAYYLSDGTGLPLAESLEGCGARIALPYEMLRKDDALPHSWDVTSDTIAAWMAFRLKARLIKATDVDGVYRDGRLVETIRATDLQQMGETCVDRAMPAFLVEHGMDALVINGLCPPRVLDALRGRKTVGTIILGR